MIRAGRVTVGDEVVTDPARDVDESSGVAIDGEAVSPEPSEVWVVHKPVGVVSTASEPGERRAVVELVASDARLYPVGRLDTDSSGLLLLTNDGALANRLTHPRYEVPKTYRVVFARPVDGGQIEALRTGVQLDDGPTAPAEIVPIGERELEVTIREGRNRQLRRMAEAVGNQVAELERVRLGSLGLGSLAPGASRKLGAEEVAALWEDSGDD
jgi:23S rRNA pseudouridine2605 synthase